jgi:signal transduction histidine kinase
VRDTLSKTNRHYIQSSSFVMAILFTILCGGAALCLGYFINYFTTGHFIHSTEAALDAEIRYLDVDGLSKVPPDNNIIIYIPLEDLSEDITKSVSKLVEGVLVFDHPTNGNKYAAKIHTFDSDKQLLVGLDITKISDDFKSMQIMGIASIGFVMVVVFFTYIISVFVVSNTNKIAHTAQNIIDTGDLSRRLEVESNWDDLSNMASVLNKLLDRIQELMLGVRQVSDNIAHDLRTPITRLHNKIDDLETKYGHDDYVALRDETTHILNVFNALLRISRIESEKQKSQFQDVNLKNILDDVIDFYAPLAHEKNISLNVELNNKNIYGDRDLLFQAYANILDNAVKFTPEQGAISISILNGKILISNTGSTVNDNDKNKIFDRFYRTDSSRNTPGAGLGLSLVKAVVDLHDGALHVENKDNHFTIITSL